MRVYFKNLDGLRFVAAFLVLLHHAFFFKVSYSQGSPILNHMLEDAGRMGVNLFFVLSGFLISYLLFVEWDNLRTIRIKDFYVRRILRIWPLYLVYGLIITCVSPFLMTQLGMASDISVSQILVNVLFLLLFAVNIQLAFFPVNAGIFEISWSVCIEEQFYLVWPLIISKFRHHIVRIFVIMVLIRLAIRILCVVLPYFFDVSAEWLIQVNYLLLFDKLDLFGGGMLMAHIYKNREGREAIFSSVFHPIVQVVMLVMTLLFSLSLLPIPDKVRYYGDHIIALTLFGYVILAAVSDQSVLNLEHPWLKFLGKMTYGIYLFHTAVCQVILILYKRFVGSPDSAFIYDFTYPALCTLVTCAIAYFSYEYFEKRFLKTKAKFAHVKTPV